MNENKEKLGIKIKQLRKSMGWTQEQLAEKIGIDNKHLSRIEKGYHMPNYKIIKKLATKDVCKCHGNELLFQINKSFGKYIE